MAKKKATTPSVETHKIRGYLVEIRAQEGKEQLRIDGVPHKFLKSDKGFIIGYISPQNTLLQAVKEYLDRIPEKA